ncbi:hypothetical protein F4680DRAFT_366307 [Xylaria scruposa]|nr:hypothetical protein F4680DRAFT_366307 [Xylaria scruposa]
MHQLGFPLLRTIINDHEIESVLPCSEEQHRALGLGGDLDGQAQAILFKLETCASEVVCINKLRHAWQTVVQQRAELRTVFAIGSSTTDIFQVVLKRYDALFAHAHFGKTDDLEAKVEHEPLPVLDAGAPKHMAQAYIADGAPVLLRLCYSGVAIDDDCLVGIQADLARVYDTLAIQKPQSDAPLAVQEEGDKGSPDHLSERMKNAEPSILGLGVDELQKTMAEYTYVTLPGSFGESLLRRCSDDGVGPINMLQALWLIILAKYLRLEQPCCMYKLTPGDMPSGDHSSGRFARRDLLCTNPIVDDEQVTDLIKRLYEQTVQDCKTNVPTLSTSVHDSERLTNSIVSWRDCTIASNKRAQALSIRPIKARGFEKVSSQHIPSRYLVFH